MNVGMVDLIIIGGVAAVFLAPLLIGYFGFGSPHQHHRSLKKVLIGLAGLQLAVLIYFAWIFAAERFRHVNHLKWIAPLIFVDIVMWVCFGIGFGLAALRYRIRTKV